MNKCPYCSENLCDQAAEAIQAHEQVLTVNRIRSKHSTAKLKAKDPDYFRKLGKKRWLKSVK